MPLFAAALALSLANDPRTFDAFGAESGEAAQKRLRLSARPTDFEATGLYLPPNVKLAVWVEARGAVPSLVVGTFSHDEQEPRSVTLVAGSNVVSDPAGGLLYVRLHPAGARARLRFGPEAALVPTFRLGSSRDALWPTELAYSSAPSAIFVSNRATVVVSRADAAKYAPLGPSRLLKSLDRIIGIEDDAAGLTARARLQTRTLMAGYPKPDPYMFATWYRTGYSPAGIRFILDPDAIVRDGWGPWHELGHMRQQPDWTWSSTGEVTVNVFSRAVQRAFGGPSRLDRDGIWAKTRVYLDRPDGERDFDGPNADVWTRLAMFEQLRMAFGDRLFRELNRRARERTEEPGEDGARRDFLAIETSLIARRDLRAFYGRWGLKTSLEAQKRIEAARLPLPVPDPSTLGFPAL